MGHSVCSADVGALGGVVSCCAAGCQHPWCKFSPVNRGSKSFWSPEPTVLEGGLHWKLPYPFGRVDRIVSNKMHQMSIGHEESEECDLRYGRGRESILWVNQHGDEEFLLLLGDGHDVMSADGVLEYRIQMYTSICLVFKILKRSFESVVYQVLMEQTSSRTLEEALVRTSSFWHRW